MNRRPRLIDWGQAMDSTRWLAVDISTGRLMSIEALTSGADFPNLVLSR